MSAYVTTETCGYDMRGGHERVMRWRCVHRDINLHCPTLWYYYVHKTTENPAAALLDLHTHSLFYSAPSESLMS